MENRKLISLLLCLLVASPLSSAGLVDPRFAASSFPSVHAEKLIRQLNLFPSEDINVVKGGVVAGLTGGRRIVEKKLKFPGFDVGTGFSVDDLGHHAGYYKLDHTHDAR